MIQDFLPLLENTIRDVVQGLFQSAVPSDSIALDFLDERGDLATAVALKLARQLKKNPRDIAHQIAAALQEHTVLKGAIQQIEVAGAGYINFFLKDVFYYDLVRRIIQEDKVYGCSTIGLGKKVIVEFVSANPTGPLNAVNARAAVVGDSLAHILQCIGYTVHKEYYVNDYGRQVDLFGQSVYARMMQRSDPDYPFPEEGYHGEWVQTLAETISAESRYQQGFSSKPERMEYIKNRAITLMVSEQQKDIEEYGVYFDQWTREKELHASKQVEESLTLLKSYDAVREQDHKIYFKSTQWGDTEDRVLIRDNGIPTYFMADTAYHINKCNRGFDYIIDLWGPDHHGYISRMQGVFHALQKPADMFNVILVQQVNLLRNGEKVKMGKRAGNIVTMQEIIEEVGKDAARYFFVARSVSSHLDFDMEIAKRHDDMNPVYAIQYAHARIHGIFRKALASAEYEPLFAADGIPVLKKQLAGFDRHELDLIKELFRYEYCVHKAALSREPHHIAAYCLSLARKFNAYHTLGTKNAAYRVLGQECGLTESRLTLINAVRIVLRNALGLLGITAPVRMENL